MNDELEVEASPVTKVARDLTEILRLYTALLTQAVHHANARVDGHHLPGGQAMVQLGNVANIEAWANQQQATERFQRAYTSVEDEDPDDAWPAFQLIEFWSEQWRATHDAEYGTRPTIASEAGFLRYSLNWAWDHEPHWDDFATDIRRARLRLEGLLLEGIRSQRGAPCMYDECRGIRLVRKMVPGRGADGEKRWELTDWHCPTCHRQWDDERYQANIAAGIWRAQREDIDGEVWCSPRYASRQVDRTESCIRGWAAKREVATACVVLGRRVGFVLLADVIDKDAQSKRRGRVA